MNQRQSERYEDGNMILRFLTNTESIVVRNKWFSFSLLSLASLVVAWLNLELKSSLAGGLAFLAFLVPLTVFTGRVFFKEENVVLKLTFGFALLLAIIAFFGTLTYTFIDYTWPPMLALLFALTLSLSLLNRRTKQHVEYSAENESKYRLEIRNWKGYAKDVAFVLFILLSLHAIYVGRTGESIRTFWEAADSATFFLSYFGASSIAVLTVLSRKTSTARILSYVVLLTLVAALIPVITLEYPQTHMMCTNIAWTRHFDEFGRFVSEPEQIERVSSPIHKHLEFTGYHVIIVTLSRLLGGDPVVFNVLLTPLMFAFYAPISAYILVKIVFPSRPKVALMSALALLVSQHNIFLLIPPGKPETLGLLFLLFSIVFWTRYLVRKEKAVSSFMFTPFLFSLATAFSHPNVGIFALAVTMISIYLRVAKPFEASNGRFRYNLLRKFGYIVLTVVSSLALIIAYQVSANFLAVGRSFIFTPNFDVGEWMKVLFPPFESFQVFSFEGLRDLYLSNFTYIWYALVLGGIFLIRWWGANRSFLWLIIPLISMSFTSMILQQFFFPIFWTREYYRFFYYLNFITYPLVGFSLHTITRVLPARISVRIKAKKARIFERKFRNGLSWKLVRITAKSGLTVMLLASTLVASLYGGFPRARSLGPYTAQSPMFVSDYDMSAMEIISERESQFDRAFFIIGDSNTAGAAILTLGHKVHLIDGKYRTFVSYGRTEGKDLWAEAISNPPSPYVLDNALSVLKADAIYLVLTNRLGDRLQGIVESYMRCQLKPLFSIPAKIFVFEYTAKKFKERYPILLADDEQSEFWRVERLGEGPIDVTVDDDRIEKVSRDSSLLLSTTQGRYARFNLLHVFELLQDWSDQDFFSFYWYGNSSQISTNIVAATSDDDYFVYTFRDEFTGWRRQIIPFQEFKTVGKPSWSEINRMRIQFLPSPVLIEPGLLIRIDKIVVDVADEAKIEYSEWEDQAVRFIMSRGKLEGDFRILGDQHVASALQAEFGDHSCWMYYPVGWEMRFFLEPLSKTIADGIDRIYVVISNRLCVEKFQMLTDTARMFFGEPIFKIEGNIYVYQYTSMETIEYIVDDDQVSFWTPITWGEGSIGTPLISHDESTKVSGVHSLKITVIEGNHSHWGLRHRYGELVDWSSACFISFGWYGQSSGKVINVYILAPDGENTAIAHIREDWSGWRQIVLPLASFELYGEPSWDKVKYVRIGMYDSLRGTWNLDDVALKALTRAHALEELSVP